MARLGVYVDTSDFKKLHRDLQTFAKRAFPYAVRNALTGCAFEARKVWQMEIRSTFTNRNAFTERSIRVEKATGVDVRGMKAVVGSVAPYMGDQEHGAVIRGKGKHKAIPGPAAAGLKPGGQRTKVVRPQFRLGAINVNHPSLARYGRRRQNAVVLAIAIRKGERFALLNRATSRGRGLFEVKGLKRKAKVKLLYNVSKGSVRVKPEPTMRRAVLRSKGTFERITATAMIQQLKRYRVMGYV
jgi:hypothetical protein